MKESDNMRHVLSRALVMQLHFTNSSLCLPTAHVCMLGNRINDSCSKKPDPMYIRKLLGQ